MPKKGSRKCFPLTDREWEVSTPQKSRTTSPEMNTPFRTQVQMVRRGTPPDFDDALIEVSNVRIGRVIINLGQLVDLMERARDCPHFIELANASIREAE